MRAPALSSLGGRPPLWREARIGLEAAALLRAYAPSLWSRVKLCTAERPERDVFGDIPVVDYTGGRFEWPVILGVRPESQAGLARRLQDGGCTVIRWDDCIAA